MKSASSGLDPAIGPSGPRGEHVDVVPLIFQITEPAGEADPTIPLTVAVNVMVPPKIGLAGDETTAIVGVALVTVKESGGVEERAE